MSIKADPWRDVGTAMHVILSMVFRTIPCNSCWRSSGSIRGYWLRRLFNIRRSLRCRYSMILGKMKNRNNSISEMAKDTFLKILPVVPLQHFIKVYFFKSYHSFQIGKQKNMFPDWKLGENMSGSWVKINNQVYCDNDCDMTVDWVINLKTTSICDCVISLSLV